MNPYLWLLLWLPPVVCLLVLAVLIARGQRPGITRLRLRNRMGYAVVPALGGTAGVFVLRALSGEGHDWRPLLVLGLGLLGVQAILVFVIYPIWDRRQ